MNNLTVGEVFENAEYNNTFSNIFNSFNSIIPDISSLSEKMYQIWVSNFYDCYYFPNIDIENIDILKVYNRCKYICDTYAFQYARNIQRIFEAVNYDYSVFDNYDMQELHTTTPNITDITVSSVDGQDLITSINSTTTFDNTSTYKPTAKGESTATTATRRNEFTKTGTQTLSIHQHGNIGVDTNQDMLKSEIDLQSSFNPYSWLLNELSNKLLLNVY